MFDNKIMNFSELVQSQFYILSYSFKDFVRLETLMICCQFKFVLVNKVVVRYNILQPFARYLTLLS